MISLQSWPILQRSNIIVNHYIDLLPWKILVLGLACSLGDETGNETIEVHGRTDYRDLEGASGRAVGARSVPEVRHISDATFYPWRKKYGGVDVSDSRRLAAFTQRTYIARVKAQA